MWKVHKSINNFYDRSHHRLTKILLSMSGTWPYQDRRIQVILRILRNVGIITTSIPEVIYIIKVYQDLNLVLECLPVLIITYISYVFMINGSYYLHLMKEILEYIYNSSINIIDDNEYKIFQKYAEQGKKLTTFYIGANFSCYLIFATTPLFSKFNRESMSLNQSRSVENLLYSEYFIDPNKYYVHIYLHELHSAAYVILLYIGWDTYFVTVVQHSCSMFQILGYRLKKVGKNTAQKFNQLPNYEQDSLVYSEINNCIKYHCECIRFAENIEQFFQFSWLMQIFANMLLISLSGFQVISHSNEPELILRFGYIGLMCSVRLFYISWPGEKLYNHSLEVHRFISNVPWNIFPIKSKKLLVLMLLRSSKPCTITMSKMLILNFESYCMLLQMSISYFTLILSTQ